METDKHNKQHYKKIYESVGAEELLQTDLEARYLTVARKTSCITFEVIIQ